MISKKYEAAKIALKYAKSDSLGSDRAMEEYIAKMEIASSMPVDVLANHIRRVYKDNEPNRVKGYLEVALRNARGDSITDESTIKSWLEYAQEHLDNPLDKKVVDNVWDVYRQNEPRRKYGCLKVALRNAREDSINDKSTIKSWLKYAQEH
ncbi:MAG: hypothetical protein Q8N63_05120, partial [Nanoarchaeota archaeon]|nr:hypothetical protein [Nanoarchaeota archaeon]